MSTLLENSVMATVAEPPGQPVLLCDIDWDAYNAMLALYDERHVRLTYDRGKLEIMTLSSDHESPKSLIGRLVEMLSFVLNIPIRAVGSMTLKREELERGLEADESYYVRNEPLIRHKRTLDLATDPPPDLAIEVEITQSALNRMAIYAALRVAEVWRFDGQTLRVYHLGPGGQYVFSETSLNFPFLSIPDVERFLLMAYTTDDTTIVRLFWEWLQTNVVPNYKPEKQS